MLTIKERAEASGGDTKIGMNRKKCSCGSRRCDRRE